MVCERITRAILLILAGVMVTAILINIFWKELLMMLMIVCILFMVLILVRIVRN